MRVALRIPFSAGGRRTRRPAGARTRCARVRRDAGCIVGEPRPPFTHPQGRMPGGRHCRGVLLFGFFLLDKQEKETGPQGCGTNLHGRGQVFAKKLDPVNTIERTRAGMRDEHAWKRAGFRGRAIGKAEDRIPAKRRFRPSACAATAQARSAPAPTPPCRARAAARRDGRTGSARPCLRARWFH